MKCGTAASFYKGEKSLWFEISCKFLSFNDNCLLNFVNKKEKCALVVFCFCFPTSKLKTSRAISRFLEERKKN